MITMKRIAIALSIPLMLACEVESGQCPVGAASPSATPAEAPGGSASPAGPSGPTTPGPGALEDASAGATAPGTGAAAATAPAEGAAAAGAAAAATPAQKRTLSGVVSATPTRDAANVVVYLEDAPKDPERGMKAVNDEKNMTFIPETTVITVGGAVTFKNSDPFPHNVFSMDHEKFNLGNLAPHGATKRTFNDVGGYTILCNLHPGMLAHIFVSPSSYFAVTDAKGNYTIKDIPEGTYKVSVWGKKQSADSQSVTLKGGDATADFALHK